jgi:hypothetical protein
MSAAVKRSRTSFEGNREGNELVKGKREGLGGARMESPLFPSKFARNSGVYLARSRAHKRSSSVETTTESVNVSKETSTRTGLPAPRPSSDPFSVISIGFPGSEAFRRPRYSLISASPQPIAHSPFQPVTRLKPYPRLSLPSSSADSPLRSNHYTSAAAVSSSTVDIPRDTPLPCQSSIFLPTTATRIPLSSLMMPNAKRQCQVIYEQFRNPNYSPLKSFPRHVFNGRHYRKPLPSLFVP